MARISVAALLVAATSAAEDRPLTLEDCVETAARDNRSLAAALAAVDAADFAVVEARAGRYPKLGLRGGYLHVEDPPRISFLGESFELGESDAYFADLGLEQPLYTGGALSAGIAVSEGDRRATAAAHAAAREEVALGVHRAFYGVLFARELIEVREASLRQLERHLHRTEERFGQGVASEFEVLRARVEVANHRPLLVRARHRLDEAKDRLARVLGRDLSRSFEIHGELEVAPGATGEGSLGEALRPELAATRAREEAAAAGVDAARALRLPTLSWYAHGLLSSPEYLIANDRDTELDGIVGLELRLPLFTGFATSARIAKAEAEARRAEELRRDLEREIELEIRQARRSLEEAEATLAAQAQVIEQATKALEIAQVRYAQGLGTQLEVTDAQLALEEASVVRLRAVHDHVVARAELRRALGVSLLAAEEATGVP